MFAGLKGIQSLDPMLVKHIQLVQGSGKVAVTFDFDEVRLKGFSASQVNSVRLVFPAHSFFYADIWL